VEVSDSPSEPDGVRACRDCGLIKPLTDFHVSLKRKGGRGSYCKDCFNDRSKRSYAKRVAEKYGRQVREALVIPDGHRHCPDCDEIKPLDEFPRSKSGRGGFGGYCKPCHNARGKESKQRLHGARGNTTCGVVTGSGRRLSTSSRRAGWCLRDLPRTRPSTRRPRSSHWMGARDIVLQLQRRSRAVP
jgi:hypothetical protein